MLDLCLPCCSLVESYELQRAAVAVLEIRVVMTWCEKPLPTVVPLKSVFTQTQLQKDAACSSI